MDQLPLPPKAENALQRLQDTTLSPMEEALFTSWTKANQIAKPDEPNDVVDYRGIWKSTNGAVLPHGELKRMAQEKNDSHTLERALQERMMKRITEITGKKEDLQKQKFDAERKDADHQHKMEQGGMKLKQAPFEVKKQEHANAGKELDIQKQKVGLEAQELGNKGKKIDLISSLLAPAGSAQPASQKTPK
jgi:hypothetical protein